MLSEWAKCEITETTQLWMVLHPEDINQARTKGPRQFVQDLISSGECRRLASEMADNREETELLFSSMLGMM